MSLFSGFSGNLLFLVTMVLLMIGLGLYMTAAAQAYTVTVVNSNGTPQADVSIYDITTDEIVGYSDSNGLASFDIGPSSPFIDTQLTNSLSATRSIYADSSACSTAPEGWPGVTGWQIPLLGSLTITLPTVAGSPYHPEISDAESQMVGLINQYRAGENLPALKISSVLSASADKYLSVLAGYQTLNYSDPNTYCLASGPGIRALDAGFPTLQNIFESVLAGDDTPDEAIADLQNDYTNDAALSDNSATLIGIANEGDRWVIDTSELNAAAPGYDHAGDTGAVGTLPPSCATTTAPKSLPKAKKPKLRIKRLSYVHPQVSALFQIRRKAKGKIKVLAIRKDNRKKRVHLAVRRPRRHRERIVVKMHLPHGDWIIKARFIPASRHWRASTVRCHLNVS